MHARKVSIVAAAFTAVASLITAPAAAQDGPMPPEVQPPVQRCVEDITSAAQRASQAIVSNARGTVERIQRLDADGAGDRRIARAGAEGLERNRALAERGRRAVIGTTGRCLKLLSDNGAPPEALGFIRSVGERALGAVNNAAERARNAIARAVAGATADADEGGE
ncbi:MAG: hypothetical protein AAGI17_03505 [Planctomycetota bacterium]